MRSALAVEGERDRADALEHRQRDQLGRLGVDALDGEVDERHVVLLGEVARDAERVREALVEQGARERAAACASAHRLELLGRAAARCRRRAARRGRSAPSRRRSTRASASVGEPCRRASADELLARAWAEASALRSSGRRSPSRSGPGRRRGSGRRRRARRSPPRARNGPNGILILRAALPWRASSTSGRARAPRPCRSSSRPAPCVRARRRAAARA